MLLAYTAETITAESHTAETLCVAVWCGVLRCVVMCCSLHIRNSLKKHPCSFAIRTFSSEQIFKICIPPPQIQTRTLQHNATQCNTLYHTIKRCNTLERAQELVQALGQEATSFMCVTCTRSEKLHVCDMHKKREASCV